MGAEDVPDPVGELFDRAEREAGNLPEGELRAWLGRACPGDGAARERVLEMLLAMRRTGATGDGAGGVTRRVRELVGARAGAHADAVPASIGPYKVLQPIGEGGFGSVYMAEQSTPIHRRVALKVLRGGLDTKQVVARFEQERQALALMDHPNIARVFDAGETPDGRPYFVMELVRGVPITEFADEHKLSTRDRLELFEQVCRAIQHAHTKGIIHRDVKPSNVLVGMVDGKPLAKVIDFGIAKATHRPLTDKTLFTELRQFLGTPEYMSPEQAHSSGVDVDTRSDVYSLGVLLYELLTGSTPVDPRRLRSAGYQQMLSIICEQEPPTPSQRLAGLPPDSARTVADQRRAEPARLTSQVRGELDWVVMRALEKDRARRYETAEALARDVSRHLTGEPVLAAPPSAAYRLRKFVRRNKTLATVAGASTLAALGTIGALAWGVVRVGQERDRAREAEREQARLIVTAKESLIRIRGLGVPRDVPGAASGVIEDKLNALRRQHEQGLDMLGTGTVAELARQAEEAHQRVDDLRFQLAEGLEASDRLVRDMRQIIAHSLAAESPQRGHLRVGNRTIRRLGPAVPEVVPAPGRPGPERAVYRPTALQSYIALHLGPTGAPLASPYRTRLEESYAQYKVLYEAALSIDSWNSIESLNSLLRVVQHPMIAEDPVRFDLVASFVSTSLHLLANDPLELGFALLYAAQAGGTFHDGSDIVALLYQAERQFEKVAEGRSPACHGAVLITLGHAYAWREDLLRARRILDDAIARYGGLGNWSFNHTVLANRIGYSMAMADWEAAESDAREVLRLETTDNPRAGDWIVAAMNTRTQLVTILLELGRAAEAEALAREVLATRSDVQGYDATRFTRVRCATLLKEHYENAGNQAGAQEMARYLAGTEEEAAREARAGEAIRQAWIVPVRDAKPSEGVTPTPGATPGEPPAKDP